MLFLLRRALVDKDERTRARSQTRSQSQDKGSIPGVGVGAGVCWEDVMRTGRGLAHVPTQLAAMAVDGAWLLLSCDLLLLALLLLLLLISLFILYFVFFLDWFCECD